MARPGLPGRRSRARLLLAALLLAAFDVPAGAPPVPLNDGAKGMTCHYYNVAGLLRWQRPGGDWRDAKGTVHGDKPFVTTQLPEPRAVPGAVVANLKELVESWERGDAVPGGVFVRTLGGKAFASIASREHADAQRHPVLTLAWDDGQREHLSPAADTFSGCPTHGSVGSATTLQLGDGYALMLVFPYKSRPGRKVVDAKLTLTALRASAPAALGMFALRVPASGTAPVQQGLAARYRGDADLERDPDVLFAERFERRDWASSWVLGAAHGRGQPVSSDAENGFAPLDQKALKVTIQAGKHLGLDLRLSLKRLPGGEPEEAFLRYYLRFGEDWNPRTDGGKLPGLAGTYGRGGWGGQRSDGTNGWSARASFIRQAVEDPAMSAWRSIGSYLYHTGAEGSYGEGFGWNLGPTGMLVKNRWYCIEQQVKLNRPDASDGVFRAWVDGRLAYERTDLRFRTTPALRIEEAWMDVYHGGTETAPERMSLYLDNVVVARRYIGPIGAP